MDKSLCISLNTNIGTKSAWDARNTLKRGLSKTKPCSSKQMKHPDGSLCQTPKENSEVFCDDLGTLYGRQPHFDKSALDDLPQRPIFKGCDLLPTDKEIIDATHKLKNKRICHHGASPEKFIRLQRNI